MKKYQNYKATSIPWLPQIPDHWDEIKVKHIFKERSEKGYPDEPLLAATQTKGVVRKEEYENRTVTAQKDFHLLKLVKQEDFVISLRSFQGGIECAWHQGIISPAYTIFYKRKNVTVHNGYFRHLFKSTPFISSLSLFVTGIREGQNIDYAEFRDALLPLPPLEEQIAIANYLDAQNEKTNRFIAKKQKLIGVLKEKKQSVINDAIKVSEEKWEKKKLKFCVANYSEQTVEKSSTEIYVGMENVESKTGRFVETEIKEFESQAKRFKQGDVLFGKLRPYLAKVFLAPFDGVCSGEFLVLKPKKGIDAKFLQTTLLSHFFISLVDSSTFGAKMPRADWKFIGNVLIAVPPVNVQKEIVENINSQNQRLEEIISRIEHEIHLIKEYRQILIAEAVTGKIDVRSKIKSSNYITDELPLSVAAEL